MFPRILLLAGLLAIVTAVADPAAARPRRRPVVQREVAPTVAESKPAAAERMKQIMYPVADLVVPIPSRPNLDVDPLPGPRPAKIKEVAGADIDVAPNTIAAGTVATPKLLPGQTTETLLIDLVKNTVATESWLESGGNGTIQYYPLGMSLVVNQTPAVHEEVHALLAALRRLQDIEASVEVRVVTTTPAAFANACRELNLTRVDEKDNPAPETKRTIAPNGKRWTSFLDKEQVHQLLTKLQGDRATTIQQAPRITAFNGQNVALQCTEDRFLLTKVDVVVDQHNEQAYFIPTTSTWVTGLSMGMQSVVTADRRSVRVQMNGYWCQPAGPAALQPVHIPIKSRNEQGKEEITPFQVFLQIPTFAQVKLAEHLTIPDGGTALISCGVVPMEVERDDLVARFGRFCGCDVKTTGADRHVFFLVTPRVIIHEEEEAPASGLIQPIPRP